MYTTKTSRKIAAHLLSKCRSQTLYPQCRRLLAGSSSSSNNDDAASKLPSICDESDMSHIPLMPCRKFDKHPVYDAVNRILQKNQSSTQPPPPPSHGEVANPTKPPDPTSRAMDENVTELSLKASLSQSSERACRKSASYASCTATKPTFILAATAQKNAIYDPVPTEMPSMLLKDSNQATVHMSAVSNTPSSSGTASQPPRGAATIPDDFTSNVSTEKLATKPTFALPNALNDSTPTEMFWKDSKWATANISAASTTPSSFATASQPPRGAATKPNDFPTTANIFAASSTPSISATASQPPRGVLTSNNSKMLQNRCDISSQETTETTANVMDNISKSLSDSSKIANIMLEPRPHVVSRELSGDTCSMSYYVPENLCDVTVNVNQMPNITIKTVPAFSEANLGVPELATTTCDLATEIISLKEPRAPDPLFAKRLPERAASTKKVKVTAKGRSISAISRSGTTLNGMPEKQFKVDSSEAKQPRIVIIGAGIAGLSAAQSLVASGLRNIVILEASDVFGGRIFSKSFGDAQNCELGSCNICLNADDVQTNSAKRPGSAHVSPNAPAALPIFAKSNGRQINRGDCEQLAQVFRQIEADVLADEHAGSTLYHELSQRLLKGLRQLPKGSQPTATRVFCGMLHSMRGQFGTDLHNVDAGRPLAWTQHSDRYRPRSAASCEGCLVPMVRALPADTLRLGVPAVKVEWRSERSQSQHMRANVLVHTLQRGSLPADYVIVTLPLGVLRQLGAQIFDPPLLESQRYAALGIGTVDKVFLKFEADVHKWFAGPMVLALSPAETNRRDHWTTGLSGVIRTAPHSRQVLEFTVAGRQAEEMRLLGDERVAADLMAVLRRFVPAGGVPVPQPSELMRSNWSRDVRSLGSHVYPALQPPRAAGSGPAPVPASPLTSQHILFAGDATAEPELIGTTLGARLSGIREAQRIVNMTKEKPMS